ncbi:hypothetical protein MTO96_016214 [Rhipicephalus appendiculatus]
MLRSYVLRNVEEGKKSVLIGADPGMPREDIPKLINGSRLSDLCVSWLFVRPQSEILSHATTPWKPVLACQKVFLLALNESVGSKPLRNVTQSTVSTHRFMGPLQDTETYGPELKRLSGQKLTVACTKYASYGHNASSCDHAFASAIFRLLKGKMQRFLRLPYSKPKEHVPLFAGSTGTVALLLASVLGTSTPEPVASARSGRFLSRALFGLWFVFVLPLSCYFRSELTSIVTLKRPAQRIDTLEELEYALDMGRGGTLRSREHGTSHPAHD